ncbi:putative serine/threonine-protein kinase isoform X2 [Aphis craccivora]|uniref:Putative serine/threonine-protein kinase isoform X2 n=1 Tax=Aphis craccivora TaxID=307492 RepID=A0A6G0ZBY4_APHCR|nr:putative serine/threonine-protein kinase isoform X2 [Aphis craccivora]
MNNNLFYFLSDTVSQNINLPCAKSEITSLSDHNNTFSQLEGSQFGTNNVVSLNKEMVKKDFVNTSTLIYKAKKKGREADLYLKKLHEKVLPRCQSANITSDIVKRDIYSDIPSKITQQLQPVFKEKLGKNIHTNNTNPNIISKPRSLTQEKHVHFNSSSRNLSTTNNSYQNLLNPSSPKELLLKNDCQNNVGITNVNFEDNISDGKNTNNYKVNKLTVQRIPCVNLKPDLVTQKLANIQIKPDNKKLLRNYKSNAAYQEFAFGLEPETCKCHSVTQPKISNDKRVARHEILKIICGMLDNTSNYPLSDQLISQLQKIIIIMEETKPLEYNSEVEDLIEEHSMVGFSEEVLKKRILDIADNLVENDSDGISFNQMSVDIENNSRQVLKRLSKIKNTMVALNPLVKFPSLSADNKVDDTVTYVDETFTSHYPNNILFSKNLHNIPSTGYVSIQDFLQHGYNFSSLEMFKNASIIKEYGSQGSNENINQKKIKTQNDLYNQNNTSQIEVKTKTQKLPEDSIIQILELQLKSENKVQNQSTLFKDFVSSQHRSSDPSIILEHQLNPSEDANQNNNKNDDYTTTTYACDFEVKNNLKINSEKDKNTLEITTNGEYFPTNDTSKDESSLKSNIEDYQLNSSVSSLSNNFKQTGEMQLLDKRSQSSNSTISSMISLKQSTQEVENEAESFTSFGEKTSPISMPNPIKWDYFTIATSVIFSDNDYCGTVPGSRWITTLARH